MKLLIIIGSMLFSMSSFAITPQIDGSFQQDAEFTEIARSQVRLAPGENQVQLVWNEIQQVNGVAIFYDETLSCRGLFVVSNAETLNAQGKWVPMNELIFEGIGHLTTSNSFISMRMTIETERYSNCTLIFRDRTEALPNVQTVLATTIELCEGEQGEEGERNCTTRLNRVAGSELANLSLNQEQVRRLGLRPGQIYKIVGYEKTTEEGEVYFHIISAEWIMAEEN